MKGGLYDLSAKQYRKLLAKRLKKAQKLGNVSALIGVGTALGFRTDARGVGSKVSFDVHEVDESRPSQRLRREIEEGSEVKGGQNPPTMKGKRPAAPVGSAESLVD